MPTTIQIRPATLADAPAIALVQQSSWRSAYVDIIDAHTLAQLSAKRLQTRLERTLQTDGLHTIVAETTQQQIVGFATCGPEREDDPIYNGELYAIYLLQDWQQQGIGQQLFSRCIHDLLQDHITNMKVWVFTQSTYQAFYHKMGGMALEEQDIELGGKAYPVRAYGWPDLAAWAKMARG